MPNLAWTYSTLMQALQDWEVHSSNKFLANISNIIGLGERQLWGDLNVEEYDKTDRTTVRMAIGERLVAKPTDVIQVRTTAYLTAAGKFVYLEQRSREYCQIFAPDTTVQAPPQFYHEYSFDHIEVVPTPDVAYQMVYHYLGAPPESLSATSPSSTTWLSRAGPDALFATCLMAAEHFIKADDRYQDWLNRYNTELLPRLRAEVRKSIRAGDISPMKAAPATVGA